MSIEEGAERVRAGFLDGEAEDGGTEAEARGVDVEVVLFDEARCGGPGGGGGEQGVADERVVVA